MGEESAVGGLVGGVGPEAVGESIAVDAALVEGGFEALVGCLEVLDHGGVVWCVEEEPERFGGAAEACLEILESGVGFAVEGAEGFCAVVDLGEAGEQEREGGSDEEGDGGWELGAGGEWGCGWSVCMCGGCCGAGFTDPGEEDVEHDGGGEEDACADEETHLDEAGEA